MTETLTITMQDGVAYVTLNRPEMRNAFDGAMIDDLTSTFIDLSETNSVRAIILTGSGPTFCAGGDLNWMRAAADFTREENIADAMRLSNMFRAIDICKKPVIAAVHGAAMGGGVGVVACADVVIAVEGTKFSLSETKLGLIPGAISPFVVRATGERWARRLFTTAEIFKTDIAEKVGLVQEVVADLNTAIERAEFLASLIMKNGPDAVSDAKDLAVTVAGERITEDLRQLTAERIADRRATAEGKEGVSAFLEKRAPNWPRTGEDL